MLTIANVPTADGYSDALTLGPVALAEQITYLVANAAAVVELAPLVKSGTQQDWGPELLIPPSSGTFVHAGGIRFRSAVAGSPAQVIAQLSQPGDPIPAGSTPFTDFLTAAGAINPAGVTDWADLSGYGAWTRDSADAPTYVLTVPANMTGVLNAGMRIKWTQAAITGYGIITAVGAFAGGATKVTLFAGAGYSVTAGTITGIAYATTKSPLGFPADPTIWEIKLVDTTIRTQLANGGWQNAGSLSLPVPIGAWWLSYKVAMLVQTPNSHNYACWGQVTLGTTASNSDTDFQAEFYTADTLEDGTAVVREIPFYVEKPVVLAAKASYFLNGGCPGGDGTVNSQTFQFYNGREPCILRARSAYL